MKKRKYSIFVRMKCYFLHHIDNTIIYMIESLKRFRMLIILNTNNEIKQNRGKDLLLDLIDSLDES